MQQKDYAHLFNYPSPSEFRPAVILALTTVMRFNNMSGLCRTRDVLEIPSTSYPGQLAQYQKSAFYQILYMVYILSRRSGFYRFLPDFIPYFLFKAVSIKQFLGASIHDAFPNLCSGQSMHVGSYYKLLSSFEKESLDHFKLIQSMYK